MNEVNCNGAGEMPGREGIDLSRERFDAWVECNEERIIERYKESIESIDDVPNDFINKEYENSFEDLEE